MKRAQLLTAMQLRTVCMVMMAFLAMGKLSASGLSGKYTIDKTKAASATNYISFNDADSDLTLGSRSSGGTANGPGVTGAVVFNIANGLYNEKVDIVAIPGASAKNTITFQSASKDSSKVILMDSTVGGSYTSPGYVLHIDNSSFLTFRQITILHGYNSNIPSYSYDHVIIIDNISDSDSVINCQIIGDWGTHPNNYGALVYSGYTSSSYTVDQYNVFQNNNMKYGYYGVYFMGSYVSGGAEKGNVISHNTIDSLNYYGIFAYWQDGITLMSNDIRMRNGNMGIYGYSFNMSGTASKNSLIANNFISLGANSSGSNYGIYMYYYDQTDIDFNSIYNYGSSSGSYCAYLYNYSTVKSVNIYSNIFANASTTTNDYDLYLNYISNEDYNDLFGGGITASYSGTSYTTLANWISSGKGFGKHDSAVNPIFVSNTDLHVNSPAVNGTAKYISTIKTDIDGDLRNTSTPDMGADEFTPIKLNPVVVAITNPVAGFCVGSQDVYATIGNYGTDTLKTVTIGWSVDGVAQTNYRWSGSLPSTSSISVKIGTYNFSSATAVYTVVVMPDSANGTAITATVKNTQTVSVRSGLKGTYLVDNSGVGTPDYTSLRAAASDLNLKGACGAVTFNIADGTYNEAVFINHIPNASATNPVVFQSKSLDSNKVIIDTSWAVSSTYGAPVYLHGSNYLTFRKVTIRNSGAPSGFGYANAVVIWGGCDHITFEDNIIYTDHSSSNYGDAIMDYYSSVDNNLVFNNNHISGGYYTMFLAVNYGSDETGVVVSNNLIDSSYQFGIFSEYVNGINISKNKVFLNGAYSALYAYGSGNVNTDTFTVSNNFFANTNSTGYCAYISSVYPANYFYNNFLNTTANSTLYIYGYNTKNATSVYDNNIINTGGGYAFETYDVGITNSDYNNLYSTGNVGSYYNSKVSTTVICAALSNWKKATSKDKNSVSGDPKFNNVSTGDLHYSSGSIYGLHVGTPLADVSDDIDNQARSKTSPNIGADETKQFFTDAAAVSIDSPATGFCAGSKDIYVNILNAGKDTLKSVTINWSVNGTLQTAVSWTGTLSSLTSAEVKVGSLTYVSGTNQTIKAWVSSPNGGADSNNVNDTTLRVTGTGMNGTYTLGGLTPNFASFHDAINGLVKFGVCGSVTINVRDGYYNESVHIPAIAGANTPNAVIFQSQSLDSNKVQVDTSTAGSWSARGWTVQFDGASNVNFRKMTITNYIPGSYGYTDVVNFTNKASNNILEGNIIMTTTTKYANYGAGVTNNPNSIESHNIIRNNIISGGMACIDFECPAGSATGPAEVGNIVKENVLDTAYNYGVFASYQDSFQLLGNYIFLPDAYSALYFQGFLKKDTSFIINNFVTIAGSGCYYGLYSYNNALLGIIANSMNATAMSDAMYFYSGTSGRVKLISNNIVNDGTGDVLYGSPTYMSGTSNYNDLYPSGGGNVGNWNGTSCTALSDWQTTSKKDKNSVSGDPSYYDITVGDLHLTSGSTTVKGLGIWHPRAKFDIDGQPRSTTTPDIGADERLPDSNDIGAVTIVSPNSKVCGTNGTIVTVKVANYGVKDQTSFKVNVVVAGTYTGTTTFSGGTLRGANSPLPHDTLVNVYVAGWNSSNGVADSVAAYTILATDRAHKNDTTSNNALAAMAAPVAKFTLSGSSVCSGSGVKVTDKSVVKTGTYLYYLLDNTGKKLDSSTSASPTFKYNTNGSYRIQQFVSNGTCSDSSSQGFNIVSGPKVKFGHTPLCKGSTVTWSDSSTAGSGTINTWAWTLGNGSKGNTSSVKTIYYSTGAITVTLKVTDNNGCSDSTGKSFSVDAVDASFTKSTPSGAGNVNFTATNTGYSSYAWSFGDTTTGSGSTTSHTYKHDLKYYVTLTATAASGCTDTKKDSVQIVLTGIEQFTSLFNVELYPNPFTDHTNINYTLDKSESVLITVFDMTGRSIATLVNSQQSAGAHQIAFYPGQYSANPAGVYLLKMSIGSMESQYRLINLK